MFLCKNHIFRIDQFQPAIFNSFKNQNNQGFDRIWRAGFLHKLNKSYGISGQLVGLIS